MASFYHQVISPALGNCWAAIDGFVTASATKLRLFTLFISLTGLVVYAFDDFE